MGFSIGRAGLSPGMTLQEPEIWDSSGVQAALSGTLIVPGSVVDSLRLRDQLLGYLGNGDEEIVPVISVANPRDSGFYRVMAVDCPSTKESMISGLHRYTLTLQPVPGYANPSFESILVAALKSNVTGNVAADGIPWHSVPAAVSEYVLLGLPTYVVTTGSSADGSLYYLNHGPISDWTGSNSARYYLPPASCYLGAASFEQGTALQAVVGRQLAQPDVVNWRLSNGLIRVTPNATAGKLDISAWSGVTWLGPKTFKFVIGGNLVTGWTSLTVMRNGPECVSIRLGLIWQNWNAMRGRAWLDLTLRRGNFTVVGYWSADQAYTFLVGRDTAEASSAIAGLGTGTTPGIRATAVDGNGDSFAIVSVQQAMTQDLPNGTLVTAATQKSADFGLFYGGANGNGSWAMVTQEYLVAMDEKLQIVAR